MDYRCRVRTLLRTVGFAIGVSACAAGVTAGPQNAAERGSTANQDFIITPESSGRFDPSQLIVIPGGPGGEEVAGGGDRGSPCALGGANCYDRPLGDGPYPSFIAGQFNTQRFTIADEFVPDSNSNVTTLCWLGQYSDPVQCPADAVPVATYGSFIVTYYEDNGFGFPGAVHAGPFTSPGSLTVTQSSTPDPVGFNNATAVEVGFSATHANVPVSAGTCYWVEFDWTGAPGGTCFFIMTLSYENAEGNRRLLRHDAELGTPYEEMNKTNLDTTVCVGFDVGGLADSNVIACGEVRNPPANDVPASATNVACGGSVLGDNSVATYNALFPAAACRKSTQNPTEYNAGDVWYTFTATASTALVSTCGTATLSGQVHGDSLMQGYVKTDANPPVPANMSLLSCSDDSCSGGLSEMCMSGLSIGTVYYVRIWAFSPTQQGKFAVTVTCPCPVEANDLCAAAEEVPYTNDGDPGWGDVTGRLVLGSTPQATVDGNVTGCPGVPNTAKGVWFKLTGMGNLITLNTDQVITGNSFDTRITVYCSDDGSCNNLTCVAANDDINATAANFFSEVEFCGVNGQVYYILVHGWGSDAGDFGMLTIETRDVSANRIPCCDVQECDLLCTFEVPQNAVTEQTAPPGGSPAYLSADTACNDAVTGGAASGPNLGCGTTVGGPQNKFTPLTLGVATKGDSHAWNGARDTDWYVLHNQVPTNSHYIIDYSFQGEGPMEIIPWGVTTSYATCGLGAYTSWQNTTSFCGSAFDRRTILSSMTLDETAPAAGLDGGPNDDLLFRIRTQALAEGYNCASGLNDYWIRINFVMATADCDPVATPAGTVGTDYDDERDSATATTYDGLGGFSGTTYEPCNILTPNDSIHRGKGGCNEVAPVDGDFILLTPGRPMIGVLDGLTGAAGAGRDVDWYKFDIAERSVVTFSVSSGGPMNFFITENSCENEAITFSAVGTLGHCGARSLDADDTTVLDAGTYIIVGVHADAFSGGTIFTSIDCREIHPDISIAKYRLDVNATPVPACTVTCPGGATAETEPCPIEFEIADTCDPTNNGCASSVFAADAISSGTPVCGTLFSQYQEFPSDTFSVDTDYWEFTIASRQKVTFSAIADGPVIAQIAATGPGGSLCDVDLPNPFTGQGGGLRVLASANADPCTAGSPTENSVFLEAGTYSLILTPGTLDEGFTFADLRCVNLGELSYTASVDLAPVGSCTIGSDCRITTSADCSGLGGSFVADGGAGCGDVYTASSSGCSGYSTISGVGTPVDLCGDNELAQQVIAPFSFYGVTYTQVNISTNGYITFGDVSSDIARKFANNGNPNAVIAPFWNDWRVACPENVGAGTPTTVWIRTTGGLGNEVTTIEWKDLRKYESDSQSASFQVVLFHSSSDIEFRYGAFNNLGKEDLDEIAVGAEDDTGLRGVDVALTGGFLTGNQCILLSTSAAPPCCEGNADGVAPGQVNFDDINAVIANWLTNYGPGNTGPGDATCNSGDGIVNFDDINSVIANWLNACP